MEISLMDFLTVMILVFALFMLLAGVFTAYFGSGKSRMIGVVLLVVGLVVGVVWALVSMYVASLEIDLSEVMWSAFLFILAGIIGALIAIGVFLLAIMKS